MFRQHSRIYDAHYVNCLLILPSVEMKGLGQVSSCDWKGMHLITIDHSGYHRVPYTSHHGLTSGYAGTTQSTALPLCPSDGRPHRIHTVP